MDWKNLTEELGALAGRHELSEACRAELTTLLTGVRARLDGPQPLGPRDLDSATFELDNDDLGELEFTRETIQTPPEERGMTWTPISEEIPNPDLSDRVAPPIPKNCQLLGFIGEGGMGQVWRVRDRDLGRTMALKVIRHRFAFNPDTVARFIDEARLTSQLEHGGIVPVHGFAHLPDGRVCFTMEEVKGRTLLSVIQEIHLGNAQGSWTLRRLVDLILKICEAIAYAHSKGVVHRDIKPVNVMVGEFGEVRVLDWGLAKHLGRKETPSDVMTALTGLDPAETRSGRVMGTPMYMSPEQARGDNASVGPVSDVFSLGVLMYEALTGRCPFVGSDPEIVLAQAIKGPPEMSRGRFELPQGLRAICRRAMSPESLDRYQDASGLVSALQGWFEGERQKDRARSVVAEAEAMIAEVEALREQARATRELARVMLAASGPGSEAVIGKGRDRLEEARRLEGEAESRERTYTQTIEGALKLAPDLPEALAKLADYYRRQHEQGERAGDAEQTAHAEQLLRRYDRGRHASYLRGDGALSLSTDPPARVTLREWVNDGGRLRPTAPRSLGETPLRSAPLPMGGYLLTLEAPGRPPVRCPVTIGRMEQLDNVPPGGRDVAVIRLPERLGEDEVIVPAGWFRSGGDPEALNSLPARRVWLDSFAVQKRPVDHAGFLSFLNALCGRGELEAVRELLRLRSPPRARPLYTLLDEAVVLDDSQAPDEPATMSWRAAAAYARWHAARTGEAWRLPGELEWEKAMRGVDGRVFPWGDRPGEGWSPKSRDAEWNQSPYGVLDCAGPATDWCAEVYTRGGPETRGGRLVPQARGASGDSGDRAYRAHRGGSWFISSGFCRPASRDAAPVDDARVEIRARLVRSLA